MVFRIDIVLHGADGRKRGKKTGTIQISFTFISCCKLKAGTADVMRFVSGSSNVISGEGKDMRD